MMPAPGIWHPAPGALHLAPLMPEADPRPAPAPKPGARPTVEPVRARPSANFFPPLYRDICAKNRTLRKNFFARLWLAVFGSPSARGLRLARLRLTFGSRPCASCPKPRRGDNSTRKADMALNVIKRSPNRVDIHSCFRGSGIFCRGMMADFAGGSGGW